MADEFTVVFDLDGNIVRVVDNKGQTTTWANSREMVKEPVLGVRAVTNTQVLLANSCYVYQNGRRVKVC